MADKPVVKKHGHVFAKAKDDKGTYACQRPACDAKADKNGQPKK